MSILFQFTKEEFLGVIPVVIGLTHILLHRYLLWLPLRQLGNVRSDCKIKSGGRSSIGSQELRGFPSLPMMDTYYPA